MAGKRKIIFSRNNIKLEKIEHDFPLGKFIKDIDCISKTFSSFPEKHTSKYKTIKSNCKEKEVVLKSPLGFYYTKKVQEIEKPEKSDTWTLVVWTWIDRDKTSYVLSYPIKKNDTEISVETRPWEILNNESFPTRLLPILEKELKNGLDIIKDRELAKEKQKKIFTEIFGYPEGPKFQTDEEKILSHGFDLKESFRKRKEK